MTEIRVAAAKDITPRSVQGAGKYAVGRTATDLFAVTRRCRHLGADLANGTVTENGCLVCPWHQSVYDVTTGRMIKGPQGVFAKIPGLGLLFTSLTRVLPLGRGTVLERDGDIFVSDDRDQQRL